MKLRELLKEIYKSDKEITMKSTNILNRVLKENILPGTYNSVKDFRKTIAWNLDREVYYRSATKEGNSPELYAVMTTGKMNFYFIFEGEDNFLTLLEKGLKKHRSYRKENLTWTMNQQHLFFSKKYE